MNKEYTVTFWIRLNNNPSWKDRDSNIYFPPITNENGIQTHFSKYGTTFKIYVLHPEIGFRKIVADIEAYIGNDTFVAFTNNDKESKLYLNGALVSTTVSTDLTTELEIGDYVMAEIKENDLKSIHIKDGVVTIAPARVESINGDRIKLNFFGQNETIELNTNRLIH